MKKISYILLAAGIVTVSCSKENDVTSPINNNEEQKIICIIDDDALYNPNEVKTTYDGSGNFSWAAGNKITVQLVGTPGSANEGKYDRYTYTADGSAAETTFTASGTHTNWDLGDYAFYPKELGTEAPFTLVYNNDNPITVTLPAETSDYQINSNPMSMIPLIGRKTGANTFNFSTATGVLKLNFEGVPSVGGLRVRMTHPSYPLCGTFTVSEQNTILASNYVSGSATRELRPSGGFSTVYVALPIGTITPGLDIQVVKTTGEVYAHIKTSTNIPIQRNTLIELTEPIKAVTSSVSSVSGSSESPMITVSVSSGESIAFAGGLTKDDALTNLSGKTWYAESGTYEIAGGATGLNYIAYKVKKDGHVYLKHATEMSFYYITSTDKDYICGTYGTNPSITIDTSGDCTQGNLVITNISNSTSYDATYDVFGNTYYNSSNSKWELRFNSGQLFADYDTGLNHASYGAMDKLSFQGLSSNWVAVTDGNIPVSSHQLYFNPYIVLRPTNDAARTGGGVYEGYAPYNDYTFDLYGLAKQ